MGHLIANTTLATIFEIDPEHLVSVQVDHDERFDSTAEIPSFEAKPQSYDDQKST